MARDPRTSLQTLREYAFRNGWKDYQLRSLRSMGVAGIIMLIGFVGIIGLFYYLDETSTEANQARDILEKEFQLIAPPPTATQQEYQATRKMQQALVFGIYRTTLSYQEIQGYYKNELIKHGWSFVAEEPSTPTEGRDPGRRTLHYRKGKYQASLEYEGNNSNAGYTYAFSLSWGLSQP